MKMITLLCTVILALPLSVHAELIVLNSGNASVGERDPFVSVVGEPVFVGGVSYPSSGVPFQQAIVLTPHHDWAILPGAKWVGITGGETDSPPGGYVYRTSFHLPEWYASPSLALTMTSDNWSSIYLNGKLFAPIPFVFIGFGGLYDFSTTDSSYFVEGENTLEFHVVNGNGDWPYDNPSGLLFQGEVTFVPEPSSLLALLGGLGVLGGVVRRKIRQ